MNPSQWQSWWTRQGKEELVRLLWARWDPIGGPTTDGSAYKPPRDEYATYADTVGGMLHRGATADDVQSYLQRVEVQEMGLGPAANREAVAAEIVAWYAQATANEDASS